MALSSPLVMYLLITPIIYLLASSQTFISFEFKKLYNFVRCNLSLIEKLLVRGVV